MNSSEKVAYLRGLMDGLKLEENDDTAKVLSKIIDVLGDLAEDIDQLSEFCDDLADQVDEIDQDLSIVEDDLYDDEDDFEEFDEDGEYYEVVCPKCGDEICVSEDVLLDGGVECPSCGENLEFDYSSLTAENINGEGSEEE